MRKILLAGAALVAVSGAAQATPIVTASLFTPGATLTGTTIVGVQGVSAPSQATINGTGYSVSFSGVGSVQGVVKGTVPSTIHAVPVAGVSGGNPTYLTGDFGSGTTTDALASGNYLSTGLGSITITFSTPQSYFELLWGSIDAGRNGNLLTFNDGDVVTGAQAQAAAAGFTSNGFQGPTGSAYVQIQTTSTFTSVTLTSGVVSFEAAGIAASTTPFRVPEPASMAVLGTALFGLTMLRRRKV